MSEDDTPQGPDLAEGVPAAEIGEGQMLAGHVGGEPVLIARADGVLYAIGAECTHYHAPLADGLLEDGVVRCPWHHACFSLKTGEAVGAPAFDSVTCWEVEETGGRACVRGRRETRPAAPTRVADATGEGERVVIVGGGAGGFAAAEMLRRRGWTGEVVMLSADADAPYDRPNCSKDFLSGDAPADWMPLRDKAFYEDQKIDLRLSTPVASLDPEGRTVSLADGETIDWNVLVLATGGEPQRPRVPGLDGENVFLLRSLADARALAEAAQHAKVAAVIGSSFIGLEVAAALRKRGLEVHVVAPEAIPFEKKLGAEVGRWARGLHEEKGVVFHLGREVEAYAGGVLSLDGGRSIAADIVVLGTGVKPRVELAKAAGLTVDDGVVVDDRLRAAPGIHAVGDIARYPEPISGRLARIEHWVHAQRQGQHVARVILGEDAPFADVPFFWSAHYDAAFHYDGHAEVFDPPKAEGSVEGYDALVSYEQDGKLLAVVTLNRDLASLEAEVGFERRAADSPRRG